MWIQLIWCLPLTDILTIHTSSLKVPIALEGIWNIQSEMLIFPKLSKKTKINKDPAVLHKRKSHCYGEMEAKYFFKYRQRS